MSITDADQLLEVQWRTVEDAAFTSGLWTLTEVAAYFYQRQNLFNRDTFLLLAQMPGIAATNGVAAYDLPDDWIATQRVTWKTVAGVITPIARGDRFSANTLIGSAGGPSKPIVYDDHAGGSRRIEIFPTPTADGTIGLLYASVLEILNFDGTGDIFDIPDDFVPYVMYGVLEDMLSKDGRGRDLARAAYCRARYDEGVALAAFFLGGFV